MSLFNILAALYGQPWLLTEAMLNTMIDIAHRKNDYEAVAAKIGQQLANTRQVKMRDGVAIVPVVGPIFRHADLFTDISGATAIERLATDLTTAVESRDVERILLNIDSPGGQANGIDEMADMIYEARDIKPITAYVGGTGASAAYWLASAANEIIAHKTAMLGSIGVVLAIRDTREKDKKEGVVVHEIVSSSSPKKRPDPATDEGRGLLLDKVDTLASIFIESVARNRGVSSETVRNDFGKGDLLIGQAAVDAGLADRLDSFENVIQNLTTKTSSQRGITMSGKNTNAQAQDTPTVETQEAPITTVEALEAKYPALVGDVRTAAATAERERILAIDKLSRPGCEATIEKCKADPAISEADAALELLHADNEKRSKIKTDLNADAKEAAKATATAITSDASDDDSALVSAMVSGANSRNNRRQSIPGKMTE